MFERIAERYQDSLVVVVGAGGIGREIVRLAALRAARVAVADHSVANLELAAPLLPAGSPAPQTLDVGDSQAVARFAQQVIARAGVPHFLFYTAGILTIEPFLETTAESWNRAVQVNLNGAFHTVREFAEPMARERRGSILLLGSIAGTRARSGSRVNPVYNATKAAISAFVNGTAMQLRPHGVRINCISPGPAATAMMDVQPPQVHAAVRDITLDGRMNHPAEIAELALFVAGHGRFTGEDVGLGGGAGLGG
jgi:NAD(P)-dependent dehydrogenase (short-subunit alcohol dehydrogenase family)